MSNIQDSIDPIEFASRDEIESLQYSRMKWTLTHAYENVPMYRKKFDDAGVHPDDFKQLSDIENSLTRPNRIYVKTTHLAPLPCQWTKSSVFTPLRELLAAQRWWVTPNETSITGLT